AFAGFSGNVSDLAPNLRSFDGYAVVETNSGQGALIGLETYRGSGDMAVLRAIPGAARLGTGYLPQFANQTGSILTLVLVNYGSGSQTVNLTAAVTDSGYKGGKTFDLHGRGALRAKQHTGNQVDRF